VGSERVNPAKDFDNSYDRRLITSSGVRAVQKTKAPILSSMARTFLRTAGSPAANVPSKSTTLKNDDSISL
jgi:hypothetical protein